MSDPGRHNSRNRVADPLDHIKLGREHYRRRAWADAYGSLLLADAAGQLGAEDLELLAMSAYLSGRENEYMRALERAHHAFLVAGECIRAARCAFWIGLCLLLRGESGRATGWLGRAQRLIKREGRDCAEQGYLMLPFAEQQLSACDPDGAYATAAKAAEIGERFDDADLVACALHLQGRALIEQGKVERGLPLG